MAIEFERLVTRLIEIPDDEIHELAIARVGRKGLESGFYKTRTELLAHLPSDDDETVEAVYFTPNPVDAGHFDERLGEPPTRGSRTKDEHVSTRAWFFLDFDPDRPTKTSATDEEKAKARALLDEVTTFLSEHGFPAPLIIDSGNGFHAYYKVTPEAGDKVRPLTRALSKHEWQADGAKVDPKVHNVARLMKFPGTMTRKGRHTDERPHRRSEVLECPDEFLPVDLATFNVALAALQPEAPAQRPDR